MHTPVHAPPLHTYVHGTALPNCPEELHVCRPLPEHCVVPGAHDPVHAPALHTFGHTDPLFCQVPLPSHVCGCRPLHCTAPGEHDPLQAPAEHT